MSSAATESQRDSTASVSSPNQAPTTPTKNTSRRQRPANSQNGITSPTPQAPPSDPSPPPADSTPKPFRRYSRRALVALSKSPLVAPPPGMPALKDWFGEIEPHVSPRKENDHHATSNATSGRNRAGRRDGGDDESRSSYRGQLAQASQMGNFRHHSSRLDERADRDSHERLRNLSETYDRNKLLGATNANARRDALKSGTSLTSRRGDGDRDKDKDLTPWDRKDNARAERSGDWRRSTQANQDSEDLPAERRGSTRAERMLDPLRDDDSRKDRRRGRSPSPTPNERSRGWERRRSRSRAPGEKDELPDRDRRGQGRRGKDLDDRDDRRTANGNSRRNGRDGDRDRDRDREPNGRLETRAQREASAREKEPAWMGDYVPESGDKSVLGSRSAATEEDELQAWKRKLKEKEGAASASADPTSAPPPAASANDGLDDIQRFKLKIKEEQARTESANGSSSVPDAPPGLSSSSETSAPSLLPALDVTSRSQPSTTATENSTPRVTSNPLEQHGDLSVGLKTDSQPPGLGDLRRPSTTQSPLSVAGIDADYIPRVPSKTYSTNTSDVTASSNLASSNGRLTPTPTSSYITSSNNTSGASPSQYGAERTDSPGSSTSPAPGSGKGSRFAKFWDNRPKEPAAATSSPISLGLGGFGSTWSTQPAGQDMRPGRPPSQHSNGGGGQKPIDGLLSNLHLGELPPPQSSRALPPPFPTNSPDNDRMQNLLSMLNPAQLSSGGLPTGPRNDRFNNRPQLPPQDLPPHFANPGRIPHNAFNQQFSAQSNTLPPLNSPELERGFVPDGMVPGLRPPMRSREPSLPHLPPLSMATMSPGGNLPFDDGRDLYQQQQQQQQRVQHQASWEQLQSRSLLNNYQPNGQNQHHAPPRMSALPPPQQNPLRQSPNHLQQQQQYRQPPLNSRNSYDLAAFGGPQFNGASPGGIPPGPDRLEQQRLDQQRLEQQQRLDQQRLAQQQYGGGPGINLMGPGGLLPQLQRQEAPSNQGFGVNGLMGNNGGGGYDLPPLHARESQNRLLMGGGGPTQQQQQQQFMNGGGLRDLDSGRGLPVYQSQSQNLLAQLHQQPPHPNNNQNMQYGLQLPPLGQQALPQQQQIQSSSRAQLMGGGVPNDFVNQQQSYGNRPYPLPGSNMGAPQYQQQQQQQSQQADILSLLLQGAAYRGE